MLDKLKSIYASCQTYQDNGLLKVSRKLGTVVDEYNFRTYYLEPNHFLFELKLVNSEDEHIDILWQKEEQIYFYTKSSTGVKAEKINNLQIAADKALTIESKPCFALTLLYPKIDYIAREIFGNNFVESSEERHDTSVSHFQCYCMPFSKIDLWVDKKEFFIHRILIEQGKLDHNSYDVWQVECKYLDILFNKKIPMKIFDFNDESLD